MSRGRVKVHARRKKRPEVALCGAREGRRINAPLFANPWQREVTCEICLAAMSKNPSFRQKSRSWFMRERDRRRAARRDPTAIDEVQYRGLLIKVTQTWTVGRRRGYRAVAVDDPRGALYSSSGYSARTVIGHVKSQIDAASKTTATRRNPTAKLPKVGP